MVPNLVSSSEAPTTANVGAERNNSLLSTSRDAFDAAHNPDTTKSRANIEMGEGICRGFELPRRGFVWKWFLEIEDLNRGAEIVSLQEEELNPALSRLKGELTCAQVLPFHRGVLLHSMK
jgi:hypothetical protein